MTPHWFDVFVALFLLASAVWSYFRGFIKEVFSIASIAAGVFAGSMYHEKAAPWFEIITGDEFYRRLAAFVTLFVLAAAAVAFIGSLIRRVLHVSWAINFADSVAGVFLGVLKGFLILVIITLPLALAPTLNKEVVRGSRSAPLLAEAGRRIIEITAPGLAPEARKSEKSDPDTAAVKRYMEALKEKAAVIGGKLGLDDKKSGRGDKITEEDKKELDKLIERLNKNADSETGRE
ncbi:MAG: CvpA family protein [Candidatus Nitrospinota bacterium M3_3B_026]